MALSRRRILTPEKKEDPVDKLMIEVNSDDLEVKLVRLYAIATRPLSLLSTEECADLESVRKLSRLTYDTPAYTVLHSRVMKLFAPDNTPRLFAPHTVGSFFVGCITPTNLAEIAPDVNAGCSLLCSDGLPPADKTKNWGFCGQNVLWCMNSSQAEARNARNAAAVRIDHSAKDVFDFFYLTHIPSSSKAIIFMDYGSYADFPGFTKHEKARLIYRMNITDVKLLSYDYGPNPEKGGGNIQTSWGKLPKSTTSSQEQILETARQLLKELPEEQLWRRACRRLAVILRLAGTKQQV